MPYSAQLPRYAYRYPPLWPPPSWQQVVAGIPLLPPLFLFVAMALPPVYTLSVVLLDAAPAVPTAAWGAIIAAAIGVVAWLLNRTIGTFDASVKKQDESLQAVMKVVGELSKEMTATNQLIDYLKGDVADLKVKKESLEKSFAAIDKQIAVLIELKKIQH